MSEAQDSAIAGRVPPHDLDAEAATLSAIMLERSALDRVRPILKKSSDFYSDANRRIYEAICAISDNPPLDESGRPVDIDIVSVGAWLRDREWLAAMGGPSYLVQLCDATPAVAHVVAHARIVAEKARLRAFIAACHRSAAEGYGDIGCSVDEHIQRHEQIVMELVRQMPGQNEPQPVMSVLQQVLGNVDEEHQRRLSGKPSRRIVSSKLTHLDDRLSGGGFMRGRLHIFAARPGMGKTAFATSAICNVCELPNDEEDPGFDHVEQAGFFWSGEMSRQELVLRMLCAEASLVFGAVAQGRLSQEDWSRLYDAANWLGSLPLWIDDTPGITLTELYAKVRDVQSRWERPANPEKRERERRLGVVVVDYLTLMCGTGREQNREQEVAGNSRGLKDMSKTLDVPVIALAQLNRANEGRGAKDRRPQLADLRESGQIEQDGDFIGFIHRPEYYDPDNERLRGIAEILIRKQRSGVTGIVFLHFDGPRMRFRTLAPAELVDVRETYQDGLP